MNLRLILSVSFALCLFSSVTIIVPANGSPPTVSTLPAAAITSTSVSVGLGLNPNGLPTSWKIFFAPVGVAFTSSTFACASSTPATGSSYITIHCGKSSLTPSTTYHFQAAANNADGVSYGTELTFTTMPGPASNPTGHSLPADVLSPTSVRLNAEIHPGGAATTYELSICAGHAPNICTGPIFVPPGCSGTVPAGMTFVPVQCVVTGLTPGETYVQTVISSNSAGGGYHSEITFTMPAAPTTVSTTAAGAGHTDWAVMSVGSIPSSPQVGDAVRFTMSMTLLSTIDPLPQSVQVQCMIDGVSCGGGTVTHPGPIGQILGASTDTAWFATLGPHTLSWAISTTNDPNPANNVRSTTFVVQSTTSVETSSMSTSTTSVTIPTSITLATQTTVVTQTETTTQSTTTSASTPDTQTSQQTITVTSEFLGPVVEMIEQNSLFLVVALAVLALLLAGVVMKKKKRPPSPTDIAKPIGVSRTFCVRCGAANRSTARFCGVCGESLTPQAA